MMTKNTFACILSVSFFCAFLGTTFRIFADEKAAAVIQGYQNLLAENDNFIVQYTLQAFNDFEYGNSALSFEIVNDGSEKRFFSCLPKSQTDIWRKEKTILNNGVVYNFRGNGSNDLIQCNMTTALERGINAYDPRNLLHASMAAMNERMWDFFSADSARRNGRVAEELLDDIPVFHVSIPQDEHLYEIWVCKKTFRVLKSSVEVSLSHPEPFHTKTVINSSYKTGNLSFFPSKIVAKRWDNNQLIIHREIKTDRFERMEQTGKSLFNLKQLEMPINTAVVDSVSLRRVGYWDGEKIVQDYVREDTNAFAPKSPQTNINIIVRLTLIAVGLVLVLAGLFFRIKRKSGKNSSQNSDPDSDV